MRPVLLVFLILSSPVLADSSFPADRPIDTRMDLGLFGLLGGGLEYSVQGRPIRRYEDFKSLLYPLRDREASDLLRESESSHTAAWLLYGAGTAVGIDVAISFKPVPLLGVDWLDRTATGLAAAQFFWALGILFDSNAEARKFNAVQRYNHLLRKDEDLSWLPPQVAIAPGGAQCSLGVRF